MILVDTSAWIDFLNGHDSVQANRLAQAIADNEPTVIPGLVLTEILLGLKAQADVDRIDDLLSAFNATPPLDHQDYTGAAAIYRTCRSQGHTIRSTIDCLIAQLCLRYDYSLLTKDRDFLAISRYFPLRLIAW